MASDPPPTSQVPENRAIIAEAKGIDALVLLLTSNVVGTSETAARALANLAKDAPAKDGDGTKPVDEGGAEAEKPSTPAEGAARRQQIAAAGGIKQLIAMLSAVSLSSSIIARKMWELVSKVSPS